MVGMRNFCRPRWRKGIARVEDFQLYKRTTHRLVWSTMGMDDSRFFVQNEPW